MEKKYYVYERYRKDNNTCFYVGRGRGDRINHLHRNDLQDKIAKDFGYYNKIIKDNLTLEESCELEKEVIRHYVFDLGYGIDINGYNNNKELFLTNRTFGGEDGHFKSGELNPQYGVSPIDRMGSHYDEWLEKVTARGKSLVGKNNPNYGNDKLHNFLKDKLEIRKEWYSRKDEQNGRAVSVCVRDAEGNEIGTFPTIGKCCVFLKEKYGFTAKVDSMRSVITQNTKKNKPYKKLYFEFI